MANGISRKISHLMQWRVFVLSECEEHLKMSSKNDTINVLCQVYNYLCSAIPLKLHGLIVYYVHV